MKDFGKNINDYDIENKFEFGYTSNEDYISRKDNKENIIKKDASLLLGLPPILQVDVEIIKQSFYNKGLIFEDIFSLEKLVLTAFDDSFGNSIYWKELALNWLEKLNYKSPLLINILRNKLNNLPQNLRHRILKILKE